MDCKFNSQSVDTRGLSIIKVLNYRAGSEENFIATFEPRY